MALPASPDMIDQGAQHAPNGCHHTEEPGRIRRRFPAGDHETRAALLAVCDGLRRAGLAEDDLCSAELILAEVLNNIVEHAYVNCSGLVDLSIDLRHDGLFCTVRDHGQTMPGRRVPNPPLPNINPPHELPEGGFGWHIIRSLTSQLGYRQENGWNTLSFVVPLTGSD